MMNVAAPRSSPIANDPELAVKEAYVENTCDQSKRRREVSLDSLLSRARDPNQTALTSGDPFPRAKRVTPAVLSDIPSPSAIVARLLLSSKRWNFQSALVPSFHLSPSGLGFPLNSRNQEITSANPKERDCGGGERSDIRLNELSKKKQAASQPNISTSLPSPCLLSSTE